MTLPYDAPIDLQHVEPGDAPTVRQTERPAVLGARSSVGVSSWRPCCSPAAPPAWPGVRSPCRRQPRHRRPSRPDRPPQTSPVGVVLSLSGRYSREGALMRAGYEVWADAVEQAGGLKVGPGRRAVRLVFADDESEPLNAGRQAERLATAERIRLWLGPFTSAISTAVATVADRVGAVHGGPRRQRRRPVPARPQGPRLGPRPGRSTASRAGRPGRDLAAARPAGRHPDRRRASERGGGGRLSRAGRCARPRPGPPGADGARLARRLGPAANGSPRTPRAA